MNWELLQEKCFVSLSTIVLRNQIVFEKLKGSLGHVLLLVQVAVVFVKIVTTSIHLFSVLDRSQVLRTFNLSLRNESGPRKSLDEVSTERYFESG